MSTEPSISSSYVNHVKRLDPTTFDFPVNEIRMGYRSAAYFNRLRGILEADEMVRDDRLTMQVFQRNEAILCGIDEVIALLRVCTGEWRDNHTANDLFHSLIDLKRTHRSMRDLDDKHRIATGMHNIKKRLEELWIDRFDEIEVSALWDGDAIAPWESVMHIFGPLRFYAHLESVYLGILARATKVATNTNRVVTAANGKEVLFFADRFDRYEGQTADGYAAHIGGASGVASDAMGDWWGNPGVGTMPHALIAAYGGDVAEATKTFHEVYPDVPAIALVDFNNDCVADSLRACYSLDGELYAVRLDTSGTMVDASIRAEASGDYNPTGVNPALVQNVREALDKEGFTYVKIIVSGGFTADKIRSFEAAGVAVDGYAVGSSLLKGSFDFTADIVQPVAKQGRRFRPNERLELV